MYNYHRVLPNLQSATVTVTHRNVFLTRTYTEYQETQVEVCVLGVKTTLLEDSVNNVLRFFIGYQVLISVLLLAVKVIFV